MFDTIFAYSLGMTIYGFALTEEIAKFEAQKLGSVEHQGYMVHPDVFEVSVDQLSPGWTPDTMIYRMQEYEKPAYLLL